MSRFVPPRDEPATPRAPARARSVYNDRDFASERREWVQIADTNPTTGQVEWAEDWPRLVTGWQSFDEFMRDRRAM
jgi:hypothetical protein